MQLKGEIYNNSLFKSINVKDLPIPEWLELRRQGIGGSDLAGIMKMSSYFTPLDIYFSKIEEAPTETEMTDIQRWGHLIEPVLASEYKRKYPESEIINPEAMFVSKKWKFMTANLDRIIIVETKPGVMEFKMRGYPDDKWGHDGGDGEDIPEDVFLQVNHYMAVTGYSYAIVVVFFCVSREMRRYTVLRDETVIENIAKINGDFWNNHVLAEDPPIPTNSDDCNKLWLYDSGLSIQADDNIIEQAFELNSIKKEIKHLEERKDEAQTEIKKFMGDKQILLSGSKKLLTWKTQETTRLNTKVFKLEKRDIFDSYSKTTASRVFRLGRNL